MSRRSRCIVFSLLFLSISFLSWQMILISLTLIELHRGIPSDLTFEMQFTSHPRIPPIIHQMWRTSNLSSYPIVSSHLQWKYLYPHYQFRLWTDEDLIRLISSKNYSHLKEIYFSYPYDIQRADLARLIVLYEEGGIYADLDVFPSLRRSIDELRSSGASLIIPCSTSDQSLINHFLASESHSEILASILDQVAAKKFHQRIFLLPYLEVFSTGPIFLTRVIRQCHRKRSGHLNDLWVLPSAAVNAYISHHAGRSWHLIDGYLLNQLDHHLRNRNSTNVCLFLLLVILFVFLLWIKYPRSIWITLRLKSRG